MGVSLSRFGLSTTPRPRHQQHYYGGTFSDILRNVHSVIYSYDIFFLGRTLGDILSNRGT